MELKFWQVVVFVICLMLFAVPTANANKNLMPPEIKFICKFGAVYNNVNGNFTKVNNPTWPSFVKESLNNYNDSIVVLVDVKNRTIKIGDYTHLVLLSYKKNSPNSITSNIRGYLLNTSADRPYVETFIMNTFSSPYNATYFDSITGNIVLGVCR